jgi:citronellol/citronellal dehydrogenase
MADAAWWIFTSESKSTTGNFLIDDDVLRSHGVTDLEQYAMCPGHALQDDFFLD